MCAADTYNEMVITRGETAGLCPGVKSLAAPLKLTIKDLKSGSHLPLVKHPVIQSRFLTKDSSMRALKQCTYHITYANETHN